MQIREYGQPQRETVVLLHGGGLSWWNYRETAEHLENEFHVVLPVLDGHAGSDCSFTTIEDNAEEVIAWINGHCGRSVLMIGGLSLGAQILLEILSEERDICAYALAESAAVIPSRLTNALIAPAIGGSFGMIRNRSFARAQFQSLHIKPELFEEYYRDTCRIKKNDMIAFLKANTSYALKDSIRCTSADVHVFYGGRERREIRRSAEVIAGTIPACKLHCVPGFRHGDLSINHAELYAETIRQIAGGA